MTDEDLHERRRQLDAARTPEERAAIERVWTEHSLRCQAHTAARVKEIMRTMATKKDIAQLSAKIGALHSVPKWSEDKAGWLVGHWFQLIVAAYILKSLGVEVGPIVKAALAAVFGG